MNFYGCNKWCWSFFFFESGPGISSLFSYEPLEPLACMFFLSNAIFTCSNFCYADDAHEKWNNEASLRKDESLGSFHCETFEKRKGGSVG